MAHPTPEMLPLVARWLKALADENRLRLLMHLREHGEASVGELAAAIGVPQPSVSKHLAILHAAGVTVARRDGTTMRVRLASDTIPAICDAICGDVRRHYERIYSAVVLAPGQAADDSADRRTGP